MSRYRKALIAAVLAVATWGSTAAADGEYTDVEWWGLLSATATVVGVYFAKNVPPAGKKRKVDVSEAAH